MGETAFEVAWAQGEAMPLKRAVEYAFSEKEEQEPPTLDPVPEQHPPAEERTERLTSREREVALLVERGHTNRRISSELAISERTVHAHLRKILKKLEFSSRAQVVAWASKGRLDPLVGE